MTDGFQARRGALPLPLSTASPSPTTDLGRRPALRPRFDTLTGMPGAPAQRVVVVSPALPGEPPALPEAALVGDRERPDRLERDAFTDTELPSLEALTSFAQVLLSKQHLEPPPRSTPSVEWTCAPRDLEPVAETLSAALADGDDAPASDRPSSPPTVRTVPPPERLVEATQWSLRGPLGLLAAAVALATVLMGSVLAGTAKGSSASARGLELTTTALSGSAIEMAGLVEERCARDAALALADGPPPSHGTIVASASKRTCELWIAGTPYGKTGTARASLPAGEHIVACRLGSGKTLLRRVYVEGGATLYESF